jgi:hypothetical protein
MSVTEYPVFLLYMVLKFCAILLRIGICASRRVVLPVHPLVDIPFPLLAGCRWLNPGTRIAVQETCMIGILTLRFEPSL